MGAEVENRADGFSVLIVEADQADRGVERFPALQSLGMMAAELVAARGHGKSPIVADRIAVAPARPNLDGLEPPDGFTARRDIILDKPPALRCGELRILSGQITDTAARQD